jgi:hypothetical protein
MQEQMRGHNLGCKSRGGGILLDARAGEGAYSWMQEQGWGHTPGCKSRGGGILLDARAGEGAYSWMQEQMRGVYSWMQEQERGHTLGRREGILLGTRDRSFRHRWQILENQITDEDIYLIELFSCSKTLLFSLGRCINPDKSY